MQPHENAAINEEKTMKKVSGDIRDNAINALTDLVKTEKDTSFTGKTKTKSNIGHVQKRLINLLEDLGYSTSNPACIQAVGQFIENLNRVFPPQKI